MKNSFRFIGIIGIIFLLLPQPTTAFVKCSGQHFVDSTGTPVFLRGIGLGGWLVPEGYMLHTPGYGSPTDIRNKIVDLIGETNAQQFYARYQKNYVNRNDIEAIAGLGFNSVRLPFNYRMLSPEDQPGVYLESGFAVIDSLIEWCRAAGMYVILDMHCAPGGQNGGNISDSDGTARLWLEEEYQERTIALWRKIAERYVNERQIAGYDLLNEPVLPDGVSTSELRSLFVRMTSEIREVDTNHIIFVEGNWYATDFTGLTPQWDQNMAYSFHKYWSETTKPTIQPMLEIRKRFNVPLWMGESGENSNTWFHETIRLLEDNDVSWCWWTHKKLETTTSPWSASINPAYQQLLDYWNGNASRPSESFALTALMQMADNLALDQCRFLPDVEAALFDREFNTTRKPYSELKIPGILPCSDYDIGNIQLSYSDTDYKKVRWDADQPWNRGGRYRNDGVDIENSRDSEGSPYSIGWIEDGEWLVYTVTVARTDTYRLAFRIASAAGGGMLDVYLNDGKILNGLSVPSTGGWYTWDSLTVENVPIQAGVHTLKVYFIRGGFNINQIRFTGKISGPVDGGSSDPPDSPELGQNYPNPFNGVTNIPFWLPAASTVTISIFDDRGRFIREVSSAAFDPGAQEVCWDGRDSRERLVSSGMYFYRFANPGYRCTRSMLFIR